MKKIKIFIVLVFFLIISAVSNNVMAAGLKNMVCTDLIHIYNTDTNFDFTVTNSTTLEQIKEAYQSFHKPSHQTFLQMSTPFYMYDYKPQWFRGYP